MPYIVTVSHRRMAASNIMCDTEVSRRAVATLDGETRCVIVDEILVPLALDPLPLMPGSADLAGVTNWEWIKLHSPDAVAWDVAADLIYTLPESGGTVGPLPDGTVIEVDQIRWYDLAALVPEVFYAPGNTKAKAKVIAAYNATQEVPA